MNKDEINNDTIHWVQGQRGRIPQTSEFEAAFKALQDQKGDFDDAIKNTDGIVSQTLSILKEAYLKDKQP